MSFALTIERDWQKNISGDLQKILNNLGEDIVADAKNIVPVDTGALRDSIDFSVEGRELTVSAEMYYAHFVELGTVNHPPQPFIRPAVFRERTLRA